MIIKKIIVAHPAQQHSFQLATALKRCGCLFSYCTTVYNKPHSLTHFVTHFLDRGNKARAEGRTNPNLSNSEVHIFCEFEGLIKVFLSRSPKFLSLYVKVKYHLADRFAKKVAKYALKNDVDAVITYDDCSPILFEILKRENPKILRILDVSAANRAYMKDIYERDFVLQPHYKEILRNECSIIWDESLSDRISKEIRLSDYFLSPSEFVTRSLHYSGVDSNKILYCPYGIRIDDYLPANKNRYSRNRPLHFIYVGGFKELKGISYLIDAVREFSAAELDLTIVGQANTYDIEVPSNVSFTGVILHREISKVLGQADVFVFPSLGDSFGFSVLEAAAMQLPLIITENTGIADNVVNGQEGFIIPAQSKEAIKEKMQWFLDNSDQIPKMGVNARKMAETMTWERYYDCCSKIISLD